MKILLYGINYHPESIGIGKYSTEMCEWLAGQGHDVTVITAMPYYPAWKVMGGYKGRIWSSETINGVLVHRCPIYVPSPASGFKRILHEITFAVSSGVYWLRAAFSKYDVVISVAPPLQAGIPSLLYRKIHKSFAVYHIQDLQLEAARDLGLLKGKFLLSMISKLERMILNGSDLVTTISEGMVRKIELKNVPGHKTILLPNWTDTKLFQPAAVDVQVKERFQIEPHQKVVLYSGNIGEKQGLEILIDVAAQLTGKDIVFLILGEGAFKARLKAMIEARNILNIKMFPLQPAELLPRILNMADVHLVLQKRAASDLVMPSKLSSILAAGGLAIVTAEMDSTLYNLATSHNVAVVVEPENITALTAAIMSCLEDDMNAIKMNARSYAMKYLDKEAILTNFQDSLKEKLPRK
jgi:colanic acid biosynthesis glycosyl transferase WcaI